jgi:GTP-binding protein EngB required for normal cell division
MTPHDEEQTVTHTDPHSGSHSSNDTSDSARYAEHVASLRHALELAGERIDPAIAARAESVLSGADERLALGVDHTIVALAGGTGSGKSSTFNAISRLNFADVGARRPTTARVSACAWSTSASALLDWLEVDAERRIDRDSALDGGEEEPLDGLILLDLPDHDSIQSKHREIVDRILPLVDLLIWVVDPQKYADEALHVGYLQSSVGSEASMLVVLNQIDTVPESERGVLVADVRRLLREDGLVGVVVRTISARTGEGVADLRETLRDAVAQRSVAARRLADELDREGRRIAEQVPADVLQSVAPLIDGEVDRVGVAVGVQAVVDDVRATARFGRTGKAPVFRPAQESALRVVRSRWLSKVSAAMTPSWAASMDAAVPSEDVMSTQLSSALAGVPINTAGSVGGRRLRVLGWFFGALAAVGGVFALLVGLDVLSLDSPLPLAIASGGVVAVVLGVLCLVLGGRLRASVAERRAEETRTSAFRALRGVVESTLAQPAQTVLDEHHDVRASALSMREPSPTGAHSERVTTPIG